jgi:gluconolactonase
MTDRTVVRLERDGTRTILADRYDGKRFSGPNDIVIKSDGAIYLRTVSLGCAEELTALRGNCLINGFL